MRGFRCLAMLICVGLLHSHGRADDSFVASNLRIKSILFDTNGHVKAYERSGYQKFRTSRTRLKKSVVGQTLSKARVVGVSAPEQRIYLKLAHPDLRSEIWIDRDAVRFTDPNAWREVLVFVQDLDGELCRPTTYASGGGNPNDRKQGSSLRFCG